MPSTTIAIVEATPEHFDAIAIIERESAAGSAVALAGTAALQHALDRGHWLAVAMDGPDVLGWIWFSIDFDRTGGYSGSVFRIAVATSARRTGIATALLAYARQIFDERNAARIQIAVDASDGAARAFFEAAGFTAASITMERPL